MQPSNFNFIILLSILIITSSCSNMNFITQNKNLKLERCRKSIKYYSEIIDKQQLISFYIGDVNGKQFSIFGLNNEIDINLFDYSKSNVITNDICSDVKIVQNNPPRLYKSVFSKILIEKDSSSQIKSIIVKNILFRSGLKFVLVKEVIISE